MQKYYEAEIEARRVGEKYVSEGIEYTIEEKSIHNKKLLEEMIWLASQHLSSREYRIKSIKLKLKSPINE